MDLLVLLQICKNLFLLSLNLRHAKKTINSILLTGCSRCLLTLPDDIHSFWLIWFCILLNVRLNWITGLLGSNAGRLVVLHEAGAIACLIFVNVLDRVSSWRISRNVLIRSLSIETITKFVRSISTVRCYVDFSVVFNSLGFFSLSLVRVGVCVFGLCDN